LEARLVNQGARPSRDRSLPAPPNAADRRRERGEIRARRSPTDPAWSPRGDRIAFTAKDRGEVDYDIFTIRPDGTGLRRLTSAAGNDSHPAWSPDGEWIAFASARGGFKDEAVLHPYNPQPYGDLYVMRADGSDLRQLTDDQFEDGTPTWIPNALVQPGLGRTRRPAPAR
jgi:Tol biopolymer transport system component